ncbi:uncharacterized protein [Drosophila virilis]|uniref:uncharacterized protein n=1 Tax=Drosophila virilis TaxID=7244 RepID=UPI00017D5FDE
MAGLYFLKPQKIDMLIGVPNCPILQKSLVGWIVSVLHAPVGSLLLTGEELQTILVAVKDVLNSRLLGAISEYPTDGKALTPGHVLGGPLRALPVEGTPDQQGLTFLNPWRPVTLLKKQFWRRWSKEYVLGLQVRKKWHCRLPNVVVEELVFVAEDNMPPKRWLIGSMTVVHAGEDG